MRCKAVEAKKNLQYLTSFRKSLRINFSTIIPTLGGLVKYLGGPNRLVVVGGIFESCVDSGPTDKGGLRSKGPPSMQPGPKVVPFSNFTYAHFQETMSLFLTIKTTYCFIFS